MIEEKKLRKLIEKEAIIFTRSGQPIQLTQNDDIGINPFGSERTLRGVNLPLSIFGTPLTNLYISKAEADIANKYHTERIEYFRPPTYKKFLQEKIFTFNAIGNPNSYIKLYGDTICLEIPSAVLFDEKNTENNYMKAVDMAYRLFKGGQL